MLAAAAENFSLGYPDKTKAIKNLNWQVKTGEWWGISGNNGSGKTSLLYCLAGLIPQEIPAKISGQITVTRPIGLMFQNPDFSLFNLTVADEVGFGHSRPIGPALKAVGLTRFRSADPQTLSYGAKQKVCLAAVLAKDPPIILLDEPTSMLDYKSALNLYEILQRLNRQGKTIIVVEHDTGLLARFTQKTLILDRGRQAAAGPSRTVFNNQRLIKRLGLKPLK